MGLVLQSRVPCAGELWSRSSGRGGSLDVATTQLSRWFLLFAAAMTLLLLFILTLLFLGSEMPSNFSCQREKPAQGLSQERRGLCLYLLFQHGPSCLSQRLPLLLCVFVGASFLSVSDVEQDQSSSPRGLSLISQVGCWLSGVFDAADLVLSVPRGSALLSSACASVYFPEGRKHRAAPCKGADPIALRRPGTASTGGVVMRFASALGMVLAGNEEDGTVLMAEDKLGVGCFCLRLSKKPNLVTFAEAAERCQLRSSLEESVLAAEV